MCKSIAKANAEGQQEIDEANWQIKKNNLKIKETTSKISQDLSFINLTKRNSDAAYQGMKMWKNTRKFSEYATKLGSKVYGQGVSGGSGNVSRTAGRNTMQQIYAVTANAQHKADMFSGPVFRRELNKNNAIYKAEIAKSVQSIIPQAGSPGRFWADQNQFMRGLSVATQVASVAMPFLPGGQVAAAAGWFKPPSDKNLKENIKQVGVSADGYKIYEFNYRAIPETRYRGVMAQDVIKKNPKAIDIHPEGYLTVDYDQIDVNMEVV